MKEIKEDCLGYTNFSTSKIIIDKDLPQSLKESTLIHEIFHCMNTTFNSRGDYSHALLDSLSEQFYSVLKNNHLIK